jgi:hypothetical protein
MLLFQSFTICVKPRLFFGGKLEHTLSLPLKIMDDPGPASKKLSLDSFVLAARHVTRPRSGFRQTLLGYNVRAPLAKRPIHAEESTFRPFENSRKVEVPVPPRRPDDLNALNRPLRGLSGAYVGISSTQSKYSRSGLLLSAL